MISKQELPEKVLPSGYETWEEDLEHRIQRSRNRANIFSMTVLMLGVCVGIGVYRLLPLYEVTTYIALEDAQQGNHELLEKTLVEYEKNQSVELKLVQDQEISDETEQ